MRLYATTELEAKNNVFIDYLYKYRMAIKEVESLKRSDVLLLPSEIIDTYKYAINQYEQAIECAIGTAINRSKEASKEVQKDFLIWLEHNKMTIVGVFLDTYNQCRELSPQLNPDILEKGKLYKERIEHLIKKYFPKAFDVELLEGKKHDLNHVQRNAIRTQKTSVINSYAEYFCEFLRTITRDKLFVWYEDPVNQKWLNEHLGTLKSLGIGETPQVKNEYSQFLEIIKVEKALLETLNKAVEKSIDLVYEWERSTTLDQIALRLKKLLNDLTHHYKTIRKGVKSVVDRVSEYLIRAKEFLAWPVLKVIDEISGTSLAQKYTKSFDETCAWIKDNPGKCILAVVSLVSCFYPVIAVGRTVLNLMYSAEIFVSLGVVGVMGVAAYTKNRELQIISRKEKNELAIITQDNERDVNDCEALAKDKLKFSQKRAEEEQSMAEEANQYWNWKKAEEQKAREKKESEEKAREEKTSRKVVQEEKQVEHFSNQNETTFIKEAKDIMADMNGEDIHLTEKALKQNLAQLEEERQKSEHTIKDIISGQKKIEADFKELGELHKNREEKFVLEEQTFSYAPSNLLMFKRTKPQPHDQNELKISSRKSRSCERG